MRLVVVILTLLVSANALADQHPLVGSKFYVKAGAFKPEDTFKIRVQGTDAGVNDFIDFDTDIGFGSADVAPSLDVVWRFGEKWSLRGQYFEVSEEDSLALQNDVTWGDLTFGAGTGISAGASSTITRLFFGRKLLHDDKQEFGIGLGLHRLEFDAFIAGQATINGVSDGFREEYVDVDGPMPNLGGWYVFTPIPKLALQGRIDWLAVDIGKYDGFIVNSSVGLNYAFTEHIGLGLDYQYFQLDVKVDEDGWLGEVDLTMHGPFLSVALYW